jgi:regulator of cell morphogenesis and NO signaling
MMNAVVPSADVADPTRRIDPPQTRGGIQFPHLVLLAEMIEDLHTGDAGNPVGLCEILCRIRSASDAKKAAKEHCLYPAIQAGAQCDIDASIETIRTLHSDLIRDIAHITSITNEFTLPEDACTSWATLYAGLATFSDDLMNRLTHEKEALSSLLKTTWRNQC